MKTRLLNSIKSSIMLSTLSLAILISSTTFADVTASSNGGATIPDNDSGGVLSTITIMESEIIQNARFCIEGLQHSWIGDLIVTVTHENTGKTATLFNRVGTTANPNSTGDDSNVNGTYEFADGNGSLWTAAANGDTDFTVPGGSYSASGVNEAVVSLDSIFAGENTAGTWTFNISDNNATQVGSFARTTIKFDSVAAVPEPGTMATVVLGTLFGGVYLRRRHQKKGETSEAETDESVA